MRKVIGKAMHFMYLIKAIQGAFRVKREDWMRCEYTERRKGLISAAL